MGRVHIGFIGCGSHASRHLIPTIPLVKELEHFARAILQGQKPRASLEDGYRDMCVLEAILKSIAAGKPVKVQY